MHRQGPRRARPLPEPAGEGFGPLRGREVADRGPGPVPTGPADDAGRSRTPQPRPHRVGTTITLFAPRFHLHFTSTTASWLNLVERWFTEFTQKKLKRGVHGSVQALERDIRAWPADWNDRPRPFAWTKTADEILDKVAAYRDRISDAGHWTPCTGQPRTHCAVAPWPQPRRSWSGHRLCCAIPVGHSLTTSRGAPGAAGHLHGSHWPHSCTGHAGGFCSQSASVVQNIWRAPR